jgi:hypothetical protein
MQQNLKYEFFKEVILNYFQVVDVMLPREEQFWKAKTINANHKQFD